VYRHQNGGQYHNVKVNNKLFENIANIKSTEKMVKNGNAIHDKI